MQITKKKPKTGTKEWSNSSVNVFFGCEHDCKYCYAKKIALRFNRTTSDSWKEMVPNEKNIKKGYAKRKGVIMFPTSHDLLPKHIEIWGKVLYKLLQAGNKVLIVSKPHYASIKYICEGFSEFRDQILFRFTIGSSDDKTLKYWEPGAPCFQERLNSLHYAWICDFKTSVSIEPVLDRDVSRLIDCLIPWVTETIWIGVMNYLPAKSENEDLFLREIRKTHEVKWLETILPLSNIYPKKIKWKDSIRKILGVEN